MSSVQKCAGAVALLLLAGSAWGQDVYSINTATGVVTLNGSTTSFINGSTVQNGGLVGGVRQMLLYGDLTLGSTQTLKATGSAPCRVIVAGNVRLLSGSV